MNNFYVITNAVKDEKLILTEKIRAYIEKKGGNCGYQVSVAPGRGNCPLSLKQIPEDTECILVIGGDGTLIRAARDTVALKLPLVGVNHGNLGYLCELEEDNVYDAIDRMFVNDYVLEHRMMLSGYVVKGGTKSGETVALNDIVIHRSGALQIVNLVVYVNGEYLSEFMADGIIAATATGSTAYNMSAGGPIVDPQANLILITPINSHTLNSKSIVLSADDEIEIEIGQRRSEKDEKVEVSFDGDDAVHLEVGDRIVIHRAKTNTQILKLSRISFLETLRKKMHTYA